MIWERVHAHHSSCTVHTTVLLQEFGWAATIKFPWLHKFPDLSQILGLYPDFSLTLAQFPDISRFPEIPEKMVILSSTQTTNTSNDADAETVAGFSDQLHHVRRFPGRRRHSLFAGWLLRRRRCLGRWKKRRDVQRRQRRRSERIVRVLSRHLRTGNAAARHHAASDKITITQ